MKPPAALCVVRRALSRSPRSSGLIRARVVGAAARRAAGEATAHVGHATGHTARSAAREVLQDGVDDRLELLLLLLVLLLLRRLVGVEPRDRLVDLVLDRLHVVV